MIGLQRGASSNCSVVQASRCLIGRVRVPCWTLRCWTWIYSAMLVHAGRTRVIATSGTLCLGCFGRFWFSFCFSVLFSCMQFCAVFSANAAGLFCSVAVFVCCCVRVLFNANAAVFCVNAAACSIQCECCCELCSDRCECSCALIAVNPAVF